jgi:hypothetical protein
MKITRKQIQTLIKENLNFSEIRFGFTGPGFGKLNNHNPYRIVEDADADELDIEEPVEDAWAGGDNLVEPIEYTKIYTGEENVKEPESLAIVEERRILRVIRKVLRRQK